MDPSMPSPRNIGPIIVFAITSFLITLIVSLASLAIYRLYFHPLSRFPGPKLHAISAIPSISSLLRGRLPQDTKRLHDRYGAVVRVSPSELSFNSAIAWDHIYGHRVGHTNMLKDSIHVGSIDVVPGGATTLTMADDVTHARQRRALAYSFSAKALAEQEIIVNSYVTLLLRNLSQLADQKQGFDIGDYFNFTTFDVMGDLTLGKSFGCLEHGRFHEWVSLIFTTVKVGAYEQATRRFAPTGSWLQQQLLRLIPARMRSLRREHLVRSRELVVARLAQLESEHRDFLWYVMAQRAKHEISDDEIILNAAMFIVAGSETTATLLCGLLARLIWATDKYSKLVREIRAAFSSDEEMTYEKVNKLDYLNACIEEALRIFPPAPIGFLRTVPKGGDTIDGHWVPGGTSVAVCSWAAGHNPINFRDPDAFVPERWLVRGEQQDQKRVNEVTLEKEKEKWAKDQQYYANDIKKAAQAFSIGPRSCIGKNVAYMEIRLVFARMLWAFDVESTDGAPEWDPRGDMMYMKAFTTWERPKLEVRLKRVVR